MFSNIFMIGFYLYFYNKFCAEYIKTQFSKSILCIIYLTIMYNIMSVDFIIKNLVIFSFVGLIVYENENINKKIGYYDENEYLKKIQNKFENFYDKVQFYLNYVFVFYEKIVMYFKTDLLKISENEVEIENNENIEMEIMLNKMKEMLNDINMDMNNMEKVKKNSKKEESKKEEGNILNVNNENINMETFFENIITDINKFSQNNLSNNEDSIDNIEDELINGIEYDNKIQEEEVYDKLEDYVN